MYVQGDWGTDFLTKKSKFVFDGAYPLSDSREILPTLLKIGE